MVNPKTESRNRKKILRASRWLTICDLFLSLAGGFLLCMVQTANADSRTGVEEKKEVSGTGTSAPGTASPQSAGSSDVAGTGSEPG
jgi:hypothetical protein